MYIACIGNKRLITVNNKPDVTVNKPFKDEVRRLFEDHLKKHLDLYLEGKLSASQRRISMITWVGRAWKKISGMKESVTRSFKKYGLLVALDESGNAQVSIDGIPNYEIMPQQFVEEEFKLLDNDEDEDEGASENDENDEFDLATDQEIPLVVEQ